MRLHLHHVLRKFENSNFEFCEMGNQKNRLNHWSFELTKLYVVAHDFESSNEVSKYYVKKKRDRTEMLNYSY